MNHAQGILGYCVRLVNVKATFVWNRRGSISSKTACRSVVSVNFGTCTDHPLILELNISIVTHEEKPQNTILVPGTSDSACLCCSCEYHLHVSELAKHLPINLPVWETSQKMSFNMATSSELPPVGPSEATTLAAALPRLAQETQLQKMLANEKMRSEQHKLNYQTLKAEHTRYVSADRAWETNCSAHFALWRIHA